MERQAMMTLLDNWLPWRLRARLEAMGEEVAKLQAHANDLHRREKEAKADAIYERERATALRKDLDARLELDARHANPDAVMFHAAAPGTSSVRIPVREPVAQVWIAQSPQLTEIKTRTAEFREWRMTLRLGAVELAEWSRPEIAAAVRRWFTAEAESLALIVARSTEEPTR